MNEVAAVGSLESSVLEKKSFHYMHGQLPLVVRGKALGVVIICHFPWVVGIRQVLCNIICPKEEKINSK